MLDALDLLNVKQRVHEATLKFIHKLKFDCLPDYLNEIVTFNGDTHQYPTRSRNNFRIKYMKIAKERNLVCHKGL